MGGSVGVWRNGWWVRSVHLCVFVRAFLRACVCVYVFVRARVCDVCSCACVCACACVVQIRVRNRIVEGMATATRASAIAKTGTRDSSARTLQVIFNGGLNRQPECRPNPNPTQT